MAPPLKIVALRSRDPRVFFEMEEILETRGVPYVVLEPGSEIPPSVALLVTTEEEGGAESVPVVFFTDPEDTFREVQRRLLEIHGGSIVVGIDPGERPGVALLVGGEPLATYRASGPEEGASFVGEVLEGIDPQRILVRVGDGAPTLRSRILRALPRWVRVEVVDESSTNPPGRRSERRDVEAALAIARGRGRPPEGLFEEPTEGEIREIQRRSRMESGGSLTIPRSTARRVALGEITLEQALRKMREE